MTRRNKKATRQKRNIKKQLQYARRDKVPGSTVEYSRALKQLANA